MKNLNRISAAIASLTLMACSTLPDCPFGISGDRCEEITVKLYLPPVVSSLSYQNVGGFRDQAIIQGGYQHTLSLPGKGGALFTDVAYVAPSLKTFTPPAVMETLLPDIQTVLFEFDKTNLSAIETQKIDNFLQRALASGLLHVTIEGHTDSDGHSGYNKRLSVRRAQWVRDYLIRHGVNSSKISAKGFGEISPVESNDSDDGRAKNRRAELIPFTEK